MFTFNFDQEQPQSSFREDVETAACQLVSLETLKQKAPRISYSGFRLNSNTDEMLPRRDLYDVKYQLMAEDDLTENEKILLSTEDVRKSVYEGGLKVWEGTSDLVELLADYQGTFNILELGCGAGIPACFLLHQALAKNSPGKFVFADYNDSVLGLLTMPNVVLAWLSATNKLAEVSGEVNVTSELVSEMLADLEKRGISVFFVSGGWSADFSKLVKNTCGDIDLILASETIYSLDSLPSFTSVVENSLTPTNCALIAAKKVYFGVGGGIVEFERELSRRSMKSEVVLQRGNVGRVVIKVTL